MTKARCIDGIAWISILASVGITLALYAELPDPIPTHFDLQGHPNGWMPRAIGAWLIPALSVGLWALLRFSSKLIPRVGAQRPSDTLMASMAALIATFLSVVHVVVLRTALVPGSSPLPALWIVMGIFWMALGLWMPRIRRNALVGVRTPWTLSSDENWARTHRVAAYTMFLGGLVITSSGLVGGMLAGTVALVAILVSSTIPIAYSFFDARSRRHP